MPSSRSLRPRRTVAVLAALPLSLALLGPLAPTAAAKQLKADRLVVAKAPSGVTRFVLWLESIEARKGSGPIGTSRVKADVRQLDKLTPVAVKELSRMSNAKAQKLLVAVARSEMAPTFNATHRHLSGDNAFYLFVNLQRQLERMGRAAGSTGTLTFLPTLPSKKKVLTQTQHAREFPIDQDGDGVSDAFDEDIDGTGGENEADPADNLWGIPDEFLVRTPFVTGPVTTDTPAPAWCRASRHGRAFRGS